MAPVSGGWTEADYYRASRAARAAWQATNQQLALVDGDGLEAAPACGVRRSLEPAPPPTSLPPEGAGSTDAPPNHADNVGRARLVSGASVAHIIAQLHLGGIREW